MTFNSVSHLVLDYYNHVEDTQYVFDSTTDYYDDYMNGVNMLEDEWNGYYEKEDYDDAAWYDLGGVNATE